MKAIFACESLLAVARRNPNMKSLLAIALTLVLTGACLGESISRDYSPCKYGRSYFYEYSVECYGSDGKSVLEAFRRNKNNELIDTICLTEIEGLTQHMIEEILDIASASSDRIRNLQFDTLPYLKEVPAAMTQFSNLHTLSFYDTGIAKLPYGSMVFNASNSYVNFLNNKHLVEIEPNAILTVGTIEHLQISFGNNGLTTIDEKVFEPMLNYTKSISIFEDGVKCESCSLAWLIRDNRQYLDIIYGECTTFGLLKMRLEEVNPETMNDC